MKMSTAIAILGLAVVACSVPAASGADQVNPPCCVARAMQWIPPEHKVTLVYRDGSRQVGRVAEFDSTQGTPLFRDVKARHARPAAEVVRLEWREWGTGKPSVVAAVAGAVLGGLIGYGISGGCRTHTDSGTLAELDIDFDYTPLYATISCAAIGMITGLVASQHHDYVVDCQGGPESLPQRSPGRWNSASGGPQHRPWDE